MRLHQKIVFSGLTVAALALSAPSALALDQIVKPYQGVRSSGMGGVKLSTGLYEENFFGNPARVTANPTWRVTIVDLMAEINSHAPSTFKELSGSGDTVQKIGDTAGNNNHVRVQTTFPAAYIPTGEEGNWAFAFGLLTSTQADIDLRQSYQLDPDAIVDIGPAFTVGRKIFDDKSLSVGMTAHLDYRLSANQGYSLVDLIHGTSLSPKDSGGQGTGLDFDLGGTYILPMKPLDIEISVAAAMNNLLGGHFSNIHYKPISKISNLPVQQPRSYGFGGAAKKAWIGVFSDTTIALELTDIGNNPDGSYFRTVHAGVETHLGILAFRGGLNQGYWALGLGLDLKIFTLDVASYGEEMTLNPGGMEDRRYAVRFAFQI